MRKRGAGYVPASPFPLSALALLFTANVQFLEISWQSYESKPLFSPRLRVKPDLSAFTFGTASQRRYQIFGGLGRGRKTRFGFH